MSSFKTLGLSEELLAVVAELGFSEPTPIQARAIPPLLSGRDVVGQSQTGSGKTAAFGLPLLAKVSAGERYVQALVLCPTRELCAQVARDLRRYARRFAGLQVVTLTGGEPIRGQIETLDRGVHVAVGTPGRVVDHLSRGTLPLELLKVLVLDEADRMLDMGFEDDMRVILSAVPVKRQTALFSATFPPAIEGIVRRYLNQPERITIEEDKPSIRHLVVAAENDEKTALLKRIVSKARGSILIFCNQKAAVAELSEELTRDHVACDVFHGDLEQRDRDRVLVKFRNGTTRVLIATDVAGRGLDIAGLDMVINYVLPHEAEAYVHRAGRTGRAGAEGQVVSLASVSERSRLHGFADSEGLKIEKVDVRDIGGGEAAPEMATLYISGGRKDKLRPGDIVGALTQELKAGDIGKIEIHDKFAYVAVRKSDVPKALANLKSIKGRKFLVKLAN